MDREAFEAAYHFTLHLTIHESREYSDSFAIHIRKYDGSTKPPPGQLTYRFFKYFPIIFKTDYGTGHALFIGGNGMPTKDAWSIDEKKDDGKPRLGSVIVYNWPACINATNKSDLTATYLLGVTGTPCTLVFVSNF